MGIIANEKIDVHLLDMAMVAKFGKKFFAGIFVRELRQLLISLYWAELNLISYLDR